MITLTLNLDTLNPEQLAMLYIALRKTANKEQTAAIYVQGRNLWGDDFDKLVDSISNWK